MLKTGKTFWIQKSNLKNAVFAEFLLSKTPVAATFFSQKTVSAAVLLQVTGHFRLLSSTCVPLMLKNFEQKGVPGLATVFPLVKNTLVTLMIHYCSHQKNRPVHWRDNDVTSMQHWWNIDESLFISMQTIMINNVFNVLISET